MNPQVFLVLLFLLSGLLIAGVSIPLIRGRIPRNQLYGFRTPKTLSSDEIWYPANRYAGRELLYAGLIMAGVSLLMLPFARWMPVEIAGLIGLPLTLVPLGIAVYRSFRYLNDL